MVWPFNKSLPKEDGPLVARVLEGDRRAAEALVQRLMPVIQKRVGWVLSRGRGHRREDVVDYTQDVLLRLFERDYRILRSWDPDKGASLSTFVGLVAEREVLTALRSGRRSAYREDPTLDEKMERKMEAASIEEHLESREMLDRLLDHLERELSPRARGLFHALYVEQKPAEEVAEEFGMSLNALYSWRSRLKSRLAEWHQMETAA